MQHHRQLTSVSSKTGLLLVNLGTPDAPERGAVYRYLKQFLLDPRVIDINAVSRNLLVRGIIAPFRSGKSAKAYRRLWTPQGSPLKFYGQNLAEKLRGMLGAEFSVELAMRYQNPSIESALEKLLAGKVGKIIVFPLFPQYASASTGSVHEEVMRVLGKKLAIPALEFVSAYSTFEPMVRIFAENARRLSPGDYEHVLFSYHGLPQRQLRKTDRFNHCLQRKDCCQTLTPTNQFCYSAQCHATTRAIAKLLDISPERCTLCFQSRLGSDPWVQPYTSEVLKDLAKKGVKSLLVLCPAFTSDCLETTVEVEIEYREEFEKLGGERLDLVPSLNDSDDWARAIASLAKTNV